jgi:hypothetical protein
VVDELGRDVLLDWMFRFVAPDGAQLEEIELGRDTIAVMIPGEEARKQHFRPGSRFEVRDGGAVAYGTVLERLPSFTEILRRWCREREADLARVCDEMVLEPAEPGQDAYAAWIQLYRGDVGGQVTVWDAGFVDVFLLDRNAEDVVTHHEVAEDVVTHHEVAEEAPLRAILDDFLDAFSGR